MKQTAYNRHKATAPAALQEFRGDAKLASDGEEEARLLAAAATTNGSARTFRRRWRRALVGGTAAMFGLTLWRQHFSTSPARVVEPTSGCVEYETSRLVGVRFAGRRPFADTVPACPEAKRIVDAGWCFRGRSNVYCLPSFIVGGAQKAATGWLRVWLARHPDLAQGGEHEIHYFDTLSSDGDPLEDWNSRYLTSFPAAPPDSAKKVYTFEKTPDYLPNATALANIRRLMPSVKLVFLLRNPTSRAYSAFQHHCRRYRFGTELVESSRLRTRRRPGSADVVFQLETTPAIWARSTPLDPPCSPLDFDNFVTPRFNSTRLVVWGLYARQLEAADFPHAQIYVAFSESALAQSDAFLDDLVSWLGLRTFDFSTLDTFRDALGREQLRLPGLYGLWNKFYMKINLSMLQKHSFDPILPATKKRLDAYFKPHNQNLDNLLLYRAPAIAVFPPRQAASLHNNTPHATKLPGFVQKYSILPKNWAH